jgi:hypothetical protein
MRLGYAHDDGRDKPSLNIILPRIRFLFEKETVLFVIFSIVY